MVAATAVVVGAISDDLRKAFAKYDREIRAAVRQALADRETTMSNKPTPREVDAARADLESVERMCHELEGSAVLPFYLRRIGDAKRRKAEAILARAETHEKETTNHD